jgi:hypothetical protein
MIVGLAKSPPSVASLRQWMISLEKTDNRISTVSLRERSFEAVATERPRLAREVFLLVVKRIGSGAIRDHIRERLGDMRFSKRREGPAPNDATGESIRPFALLRQSNE